MDVELNLEKTRMNNVLKGDAFAFLEFDLRMIQNRSNTGTFNLMTRKKKALTAVKARIREEIRNGGAKPAKEIVKQINTILAGWVNYFRVGNSSDAFSEVCDYTEMKIRTLLTRRKLRRKSSIGWRRWSIEYLYDALGLLLGLESLSP